MRAAVAIDMETVGFSWDEIDVPTQEYLELRARKRLVREGRSPEEAPGVARDSLGLSPGTGKIVAIALVNLENGQGALLHEGSGGWAETKVGDTRVFRGPESEILRQFWTLLQHFGRVVTYNGRAFDIPFAFVRSALHGFKPSRNLLGNRYSISDHCDVSEVLTFFGAAQERFSLDYWCRRFGVETPKVDGIDGSRVGEMYRQGRITEIAEYCLRDARATGELYARLERNLVELYLNR